MLVTCMNFCARLIALGIVDASFYANFSLNLLEGYSPDIIPVNATLSSRSDNFNDSLLNFFMYSASSSFHCCLMDIKYMLVF